MSESKKKTGDSGQRGRGSFPPWARSLAAAIAGMLLAALCRQLPTKYQAPCQLAAHIVPQACNSTDNPGEI